MKTIKRLILLFILGSFSVYSFAQTESLLNIPTDFTFKGYAEVDLKFSQLIEENATYFGVKAGTAINSMIGIGISAGGFVTHNQFQPEPINGLAFEQMSALMGYTGIFVEYIPLVTKKVHFSIPFSAGPGAIALFEQELLGGVGDEDMVEFSGFMVYEPAVNLEINIIKEVKLLVGAGYRWVQGSNLDILEDSDLSGLNINVGLRIAAY